MGQKAPNTVSSFEWAAGLKELKSHNFNNLPYFSRDPNSVSFWTSESFSLISFDMNTHCAT